MTRGERVLHAMEVRSLVDDLDVIQRIIVSGDNLSADLFQRIDRINNRLLELRDQLDKN